jgi:transposase
LADWILLIMKNKTKLSAVPAAAVSANSRAAAPDGPFTVGMDLGDRKHSVCVLDAAGKVIHRARIANDRTELRTLSEQWQGALFVMEVGVHSPWISRFMQGLGCRVIVANARKVRAIYQSERKDDDRDAEQLARIARVDESLLHGVQHGTVQEQHDLLVIKLRDALVSSRVGLINAVRFTLKSLGYTVCNPSTERFHKKVREEIPAQVRRVIEPMLAVLEATTEQIKAMEREIARLIRERYHEAQRLEQIPGVGPVTALCFVLKVGHAQRFGRVRDIGAYLGLVPKRDQSGKVDKELGISKCGDRTLRRLLVNCAQYIMGPFGPPGALRACGERLAGTTAKEKKRAVIAVARKLAVVMLTLWKNGTVYEARAPQNEALPAAA